LIKFNNSQQEVADMVTQIEGDIAGSYPINGIEQNLPGYEYNVAVDLGANVGLFTTEAVKAFKNVYAFEAVSGLAGMTLIRTMKKSKNNTTRVYNLAASSETGKLVKIHKAKSNHIGDSSLLYDEKTCSNDFEYCMTISLEDIFKLIGHDYIDYMKVDIEGSEYDFFINKDCSNIGVITMEVHSDMENYNVLRPTLNQTLSETHVGYELSEHNIICINKNYHIAIPPQKLENGIQSDLSRLF
jgi:FkbM family methyltransferase